MSTFLKTVAIGLDDFAASIFLRRNDLTISSACGLVQRGDGSRLGLGSVRFSLLKWIGAGLEFFWPGHCAGAIASDKLRAASTLKILV